MCPVEAQQDLFDNIRGLLIEYLDIRRNCWVAGRGVSYEYDKRKRVTVVVVQRLGGKKRPLKVPLSNVKKLLR